MLPVALAALPVALPPRYRGGRARLRIAAAVMLAAWIVLALPSVGLLYAPAAAVMILAAATDDGKQSR